MTKERILYNFMDEVWNKKQLDKVEKYVHKQYTIYLDTADPWEGKTLSHDTFIERLRFSFDAFPDMHFKITSAIEDDNHVAITWILTGTHRGKIGDFQPTHKSIETTGMTIYHFKDNRINGHSQVFDRKVVAKQLGAV